MAKTALKQGNKEQDDVNRQLSGLFSSTRIIVLSDLLRFQSGISKLQIDIILLILTYCTRG